MGCSLSSACGHIVPTRSDVPVLANAQDTEGTVLTIQVALEDLPVPNKFADAFSCNHKIPEEVSIDLFHIFIPKSLYNMVTRVSR